MSAKEIKEKVSKEERLERYSKVVESAQLDTIQLLNVSFDVNPVFFDPDSDNELGYEVDLSDSHYEPDSNVAVAFVECSVSARQGDEQTLSCVAHYSVVYNLSEACDPEATTAFMRKVAIFACFPYFRSLFANLDWAANTRLPPLPVHKEAAPLSKKRKAMKTIEA